MEILGSVEKKYDINLKGLTQGEVELLLALIDFPSWHSQPEEISAFLIRLSEGVLGATDHDVKGVVTPDRVGYVSTASFSTD